MTTVVRPSKNRLTQGYSRSHRAYDFSGYGDPNVYACKKGKVVISIDTCDKNWLQGHSGDPSPWRLTTQDYGNFCKILHTNGSFSLYAHLRRGSVPRIGSIVQAGEKIAIIGNSGNSTGKHLHFEYRSNNNINLPVEFVDSLDNPMLDTFLKHIGVKNLDEAKQVWDQEKKFLEDERKKTKVLEAIVKELRPQLAVCETTLSAKTEALEQCISEKENDSEIGDTAPPLPTIPPPNDYPGESDENLLKRIVNTIVKLFNKWRKHETK